MKAVLCKAFGPSESRVPEDAAEPAVGSDDVPVGHCYPREQVARALRDLSGRRATGKLVLTVNGGDAA